MNRAVLKQRAKENLSSTLGMSIVAMIIYGAIVGLLGMTAVGIILLGVVAFGYTAFFLQISRTREAKLETLFDGFSKSFTSSMVAGLLQYVFIFLWSLLFLIPGIVKSYSYAMTYYILVDNPGMDGNTAITESRKMMDGNKAKLFVLDLSFIGWHLLAILTLGILYIWLTPYIDLTRAEFYKELKAQQGGVIYAEAKVVEPNNVENQTPNE